MEFKCPVTGLTLRLEHFGAKVYTKVAGVHPVVSLPVSTLNKIYYKGSKHNTLTEQDCQILFAAYLSKSTLVRYEQPLAPKDIPNQLVHQYMELVISLANKKVSERVTDNFPEFNAAAGIEQLANWLFMINEAIVSGYHIVDTKEASNTDTQELLLEEMQERKRARAAISAARRSREKSINAVKVWALMQLDGTISALSYETVSKVLNKPNTYPINAIKEVKYLVLDYLPETRNSDAIKKSELIQWLNKLIAEKVEILMYLSDSREEHKALERELVEIDSSYAIVRNGESHVNSAVPVAKKVSDLLDNSNYQESDKAASPVPTNEPREQDYPNKMAYVIACKKWERALDRQEKEKGSEARSAGDELASVSAEPCPRKFFTEYPESKEETKETELAKAFRLLDVGNGHV